MPIDYSVLPLGKGKTRQRVKAFLDRQDAKRLKSFRDEVWAREQMKDWRFADHGDYAYCQHCGKVVQRGAILTGEVHHRISRRHKATRYDPDNGVLLCNYLVNGCHEKAERGEIDV